MVAIFFILRNYIISDLLLNITASSLNDINQILIPKELLAGFLSAVIRLLLKGLIEDTTMEITTFVGTPKISNPEILEQNLLKGSDEPSGSDKQPSGSGEASVSGEASGSGQGSGEKVITDSDYGYSSDEESYTRRSDSNDEYSDPVNKMIYSHNDALKGQSKETLEEVKSRLELMKNEYIRSQVPAAKKGIEMVENKLEACHKELEKIASEENNLKDNKSKEKESDDKGKEK